MKKVVIADDEALIIRGIKKLVDWDALGVSVVGEACDGDELMTIINRESPDIVISDIMMPHKTGLEVIKETCAIGLNTKFIFISGYREFNYAQEALKNGAVDYLLKPVAKKDLEAAIKKAISSLQNLNTAEIFNDEVDEIQEVFSAINNGHEYENEELYELFRAENIEFQNHFFVGLCVGICPDIAFQKSKENFAKFNLLRFSVFNTLTREMVSNRLGFVLKKDEAAANFIGVFPEEDRDKYVDKYIVPMVERVENTCQIPLVAGIGNPVDIPKQMFYTYKSAKFAHGLYFFGQNKINDIEKVNREYHTSFDDYKKAIERAFRAIIEHDENAIYYIDKVMDAIESIHYGNMHAVQMRTMNFTGELSSKLDQYHLLKEEFYSMQDNLQNKVDDQMTMSSLRECIRNHYSKIIEEVNRNPKSKDKEVIESIKEYLNYHYAEEISVEKLSDIACVSPNYFSAMFKKETGEGYKNYLTRIRMEKAVELLQTTDLKTYEIGENVGYNNSRRFVEAFKQNYGETPVEYKKRLRANQ